MVEIVDFIIFDYFRYSIYLVLPTLFRCNFIHILLQFSTLYTIHISKISKLFGMVEDYARYKVWIQSLS